MERKFRRLGQVMFILLALLLVPGTSVGDWSDPYFVFGIIEDEEGDEVEDATIIIQNLETLETNLLDSDGEDRDDAVTITTGSNGSYMFQLLDFAEGFNDGDKIKVTATKGDDTGSVTVTVDVSESAGIRDADITLGEADEEEAPTTCASAMILGLIGLIGLIWKVYPRKKEDIETIGVTV